jgi:hypothetical protein
MATLSGGKKKRGEEERSIAKRGEEERSIVQLMMRDQCCAQSAGVAGI